MPAMNVVARAKAYSTLSLLLLLLVLLHLASFSSATLTVDDGDDDAASPYPTAASTNAPNAVTVFMCADSGEYSGAHELGFLQSAMEEAEVLTLAHCQSAQMGYIRHADGHRVRSLTVTTGIGYVSATLCTGSVLQLRHHRQLVYKTVVFIGTSGFSPMVNGWDPTKTAAYDAFAAAEHTAMFADAADVHQTGLTSNVEDAVEPAALFKTRAEAAAEEATAEARERSAILSAGPHASGHPLPSQLNFEVVATGEQLEQDGCAPRLATEATPLAVGSVCVTAAAFFMESGSCTERLRGTQCSRPHCSGFQRGVGSESKMYYVPSDLAKSIEAASQDKEWPAMPAKVQDGVRRFWEANEAMEPARRQTPPATPTFVTCAEGTVNAINVGAERDYLCREYTAYTLNEMHRNMDTKRHRDADPVPLAHTAKDVVCVQAMEAVGFLRAVAADPAGTAPSIPMAVLRTASNYDMYPLRKVFVPAVQWQAALAAGEVPVSAAVAAALRSAQTSEEGKTSEAIRAYTWEQHFGFMPAAEYEKFVVDSFHYSVKTVTFVVSNYFFGGRTFE